MRYDFSQFISYHIINASVDIKRQMLASFLQEGISITFEQWMILSVLYNTPDLIQSDIATFTHKDKTNVTRMLDVLVKDGYIEKTPSSSDRRSVRVSLTELGESVVSRLITPVEKLNQKLQGNMTAEELETFLAVVDSFRCTEKRKEENE